jgi:hypothetical protein
MRATEIDETRIELSSFAMAESHANPEFTLGKGLHSTAVRDFVGRMYL